ncbi:MAG: multicopper oxidase family protein [Actinomycetota bacterium]|nr:multicopper oxidase family protein [Actinomycetota bacterium]
MWQASLMPDRYSVMNMGYVDYGGGTGEGMSGMHQAHTGGVDVSTLVDDPGRRADVKVQLIARQQTITLDSGRKVEGFTLNGTSPGPVIHAVHGQMVEVELINKSVPEGVSLHWHGVDVPNAMDGVAGVTQDAVPVGGRFVYRFLADRAGSYWYHSHQISHEQVKKGLLGALVISPTDADLAVKDVPALIHAYGGRRTINGADGDLKVAAAPGKKVRVRLINSDNGPMPVWVGGAPYRVAAVDGTEVNGPTPVTGKSILVTAGGRNDLEFVMPKNGAGVRIEMAGAAIALGRDTAKSRQPRRFVDLLAYGSPAPLGLDPGKAERSFDYSIGRRPGFLDGRPGMWWTINGHLFPDVPMFMVDEGDVVRIRISNHSGDVHPMHLHGHHALVLSRNGKPATGSPWWIDSLNVASGEKYEVAFLADNPGLWMDHCHNLPHAAQGLVSHLMYSNVKTSYVVGGGDADNEPE